MEPVGELGMELACPKRLACESMELVSIGWWKGGLDQNEVSTAHM